MMSLEQGGGHFTEGDGWRLFKKWKCSHSEGKVQMQPIHGW